MSVVHLWSLALYIGSTAPDCIAQPSEDQRTKTILASVLIFAVDRGSRSPKNLFVIIIALKAEPGSLRSANDVTEPVPWKTTDNDLMAVGTTQHDDLQQILLLGVDISMPPLSLSELSRISSTKMSRAERRQRVRGDQITPSCPVLSSQSETKPQKIR